MENRQIFLYLPAQGWSDRDGTCEPLNGLGSKRSSRSAVKCADGRQSVIGKRTRNQVAKRTRRLSGKASTDNEQAARTKTDTGGWAEDAKVSERTVAKELGKMAPYVRKKGRSREPQ